MVACSAVVCSAVVCAHVVQALLAIGYRVETPPLDDYPVSSRMDRARDFSFRVSLALRIVRHIVILRIGGVKRGWANLSAMKRKCLPPENAISKSWEDYGRGLERPEPKRKGKDNGQENMVGCFGRRDKVKCRVCVPMGYDEE